MTNNYDAGDRLTQLGHDLPGTTGDVAYGFSFNPAGQLSGQSVSNPAYVWTPPAQSLTATADGLNRDSAIAVAGGYDANQNLTNDGSRQFGYDGENRLTGTGGGGTTPLALVYDPLGRLQQTTAGTGASAVVTRFIYDGDRLIAELGAGGTTVLRRYVHGAGVDEPVLWWEGSGTADGRSLLADRQGSIVATAPLAGRTSTVSLYTYGPYGERTSWGGSRFAYTGQIALPEASLYHYKARAYDPARGWFLQTDPIGYEAGDFNLYAYTGGDPVNKADPSGLCPLAADGVPCEAVYSPGVQVGSDALREGLNAIAAEQDINLIVYSGDRSPESNAAVGGAKSSAHLGREAADVIFQGKSKAETAERLFGSEARRDRGIRQIYHKNGSALPEHSHLDMRRTPDLKENTKNDRAAGAPRYSPLLPSDFRNKGHDRKDANDEKTTVSCDVNPIACNPGRVR